MRQVPYFVPDIGEAEIDEVVETLRSGWLTTGPRAQRFEREFADYVGARHAVATSSGTAALQLALDAAGVGPGHEVIVPAMTFAATASVVFHAGARPVVVDCRPDTLNLDVERAEAAITPRTRALLPVHFAGHPVEIERFQALARAHGLALIEDAAHAASARWRDRPVGSLGPLTCFSLYANKTITSGEGGVLTTDDEGLARRARLMGGFGINRSPRRGPDEGAWYYEIEAIGWKFNLPDLAAAVAIHQLRRAEEFLRRRQHCAALYGKGLADVPELQLPCEAPEIRHAWHLYVIQLHLDRLRIGRQGFIERLAELGVGTGVHYIPLHLHPYYRDTEGYRPESCPVASAAYPRLVSLPIHPRMGDADIEHVIDAVRQVIARNRR